MGQIRVLIADDHAVLREGLRQLLEIQQDITVVGEAGDGIEALELARKNFWPCIAGVTAATIVAIILM